MDTNDEKTPAAVNGQGADDSPGRPVPVVHIDVRMAARLGEAARGHRGTEDRIIEVPDQVDEKVKVRTTPRIQRNPGSVEFRILPDVDLMAGKRKPTRIIIEYDDGTLTEMDAGENDALFWSQAACEKFLFPYYASQYGVEDGYALREEYLMQDSTVVCHLPGSEPCDPDTCVISAPQLHAQGVQRLQVLRATLQTEERHLQTAGTAD